jgi:signal transduction histidine kinase
MARLGGELLVANRVGGGAVFSVCLPRLASGNDSQGSA